MVLAFFKWIETEVNMAKELVLALGGGGVRGCAHIGTVRCLMDHGYKISGIAGSSAGGMFGAVFASGANIDEVEKLVVDFFKHPDFKRTPGQAAFAGTRSLEHALAPFIGDKNIEDFPIPFVATAVGIRSGHQIAIKTGNALEAVLATIAIPGIFPSFHTEADTLVDGAVIDPVPIELARSIDPILPVVAVPLHYKPSNFTPDQAWLPFSDTLPESFYNMIVNTRFGEIALAMNASLELATERLSELTIENAKPDVVSKPIVGHFGPLESIDPIKLIDEGYRAMKECLPALKASYSLKNTFLRITKYAGLKKI